MLPDGTVLGALQVSTDPVLYVYGHPDVLAWIRHAFLKEGSRGMPPDPTMRMPNWR